MTAPENAQPPPPGPPPRRAVVVARAAWTVVKVAVGLALCFLLMILLSAYNQRRAREDAKRRVEHYQNHPEDLRRDLKTDKRVLFDGNHLVDVEQVDVRRLPPVRLEGTPPPLFASAEDAPRVDGATAFYPLFEGALYATVAEPRDDIVRRRLECSRTSAAYRRLIQGATDVVFAFEPSAGQRTEAAAAGVELRLTPIGREAFVFFVRDDNPVSGLELGQIRDIYAGRIKNWNAVGGPDLPIRAFQRAENSGSQTTMRAAVMQGAPIDLPPTRLLAAMSTIIAMALAYDNAPDAIGYSFLYYAGTMANADNIKFLAVDGVAPSPATVADGGYPLTRVFYAVTTQRSRPGAARLVEWLGAEQGRELIRRSGYTPMNGRGE